MKMKLRAFWAIPAVTFSSILFMACNNDKEIVNPANVQKEKTALEEIDALYGGATTKLTYVDQYTQTKINFKTDVQQLKFDNRSETTIKASINKMENRGDLSINGVLIPFTGQMYYYFTKQANGSSFNNTAMNVYFVSRDPNSFPSFAGSMNSGEQVFAIFSTADTLKSLSRKDGCMISWDNDKFQEGTEKTTVMVEGVDLTGNAPKVWIKEVTDLAKSVAIAEADLKTFEKCSAVKIYVVRGKVVENAITHPATRLRSITYAVQQIPFRD